MINNPRFWLALILYFASASLFAGVRAHGKKKPALMPNIYLLMALCSSIGLWFYAGTASYTLKEAFNLINLLFILSGALTGFGLYFLPLLFLIPIVFSFIYKIPGASFVPAEKIVFGEMHFYPSNEGVVNLIWDSEGKEKLVTLKGDAAGILFVKKTVPSQYFFLETRIYPLAILSESHPVTDLVQADPDWFFPLTGEEEWNSSLYKSTFPAVKFHNKGFFNSYTYVLEKGEIIILRN